MVEDSLHSCSKLRGAAWLSSCRPILFSCCPILFSCNIFVDGRRLQESGKGIPPVKETKGEEQLSPLRGFMAGGRDRPLLRLHLRLRPLHLRLLLPFSHLLFPHLHGDVGWVPGFIWNLFRASPVFHGFRDGFWGRRKVGRCLLLFFLNFSELLGSLFAFLHSGKKTLGLL